MRDGGRVGASRKRRWRKNAKEREREERKKVKYDDE